MKQPKKLTRAQKEFLKNNTRFNPENWVCLYQDQKTKEYKLMHKTNNRMLEVNPNTNEWSLGEVVK